MSELVIGRIEALSGEDLGPSAESSDGGRSAASYKYYLR